jgi:hypothetical protein
MEMQVHYFYPKGGFMAKKEELRARLRISTKQLEAINDLLMDPKSRVVKDFLAVVASMEPPKRSTPGRRKRENWKT